MASRTHGSLQKPRWRLDLNDLVGLLDQLPDSPFFVKDETLRYVAANTAMLRLCGIRNVRELIGKRAADFFPPRLARHYERLDRTVLASGRALRNRIELSLGTRGTSNWLLFSRMPVVHENGKVHGVAALAQSLPGPDHRFPKYERLAGTVKHIQAHYREPLSLRTLAALAGVSASQLERDFRSVFRSSLQQFHHTIRIDHALRLLEGPPSVTEIAHACGFTDHSAFTRRFRAFTGLTPVAYRKHVRSNSEITAIDI
jgi:AraC-like DNA-binding protein